MAQELGGDLSCSLMATSDFDMNFKDRFSTLEEVKTALKNDFGGKCGLIFGIDFTMSNKTQGQQTFGGKSLHDVSDHAVNPYQEVICILGETLEQFDDDGIIPAYGFGDRTVTDTGIFSLKKDGQCEGFLDVLDAYNETVKSIKLGGPTNFAPLIDAAVEIVKKTKEFHVLVIAADGQVTNKAETVESILKASNYALSIVVIGVGDGPWEMMEEFDDELPSRKFDNFQFVNFHKIKATSKSPEAAIALASLMEIPDQYQAIKNLRLLPD